MPAEPPPLDLDRLVATLDRFGVQYLLVGGVAAIAHGAQRPNKDLDCLAMRSEENLERFAAALRELGSRLRVEGLSDEEAAALPVRRTRTRLVDWRSRPGAQMQGISMCSPTYPMLAATGSATATCWVEQTSRSSTGST